MITKEIFVDKHLSKILGLGLVLTITAIILNLIVNEKVSTEAAATIILVILFAILSVLPLLAMKIYGWEPAGNKIVKAAKIYTPIALGFLLSVSPLIFGDWFLYFAK